jgi:hypothetical protein
VSETDIAVATFGMETEALMMAELLKSEGIPCVLVSIGAGAGGLGPTVWRPFELRVRKSDAARATQLLDSVRDR